MNRAQAPRHQGSDKELVVGGDGKISFVVPKLQAPQPTGDLLLSLLVTQATHPRRKDVCLPNDLHVFAE